KGDIELAESFFKDQSMVLSDEEATKLVDCFVRHNDLTSLIKISEGIDVGSLLHIVNKLKNEECLDEAKAVYVSGKIRDASIRSQSLDKFFGITEEKVKLKVVEKLDFGSVTELARHREDSTTFEDVVGLSQVKKQVHKKIILPFQKPSLFQRFKKKVGGGVLLYGPPGCGKTLLARATAGQCNASFFNVEISDVLDMYIGESEQKLHAIFEKARAEAPSVLFFDELEALAGKREHARNSSTSNTVSQFLTELDGFSQNNDGVLVLASTNVPWSIDSAFLRPGRFDRMFFVPPPDKEARQSILEHHMKERPSLPDIDYKGLATKTPGYSGADLANLVDMAADEAIEESIESGKEVSISSNHFKEALGDSRATTTEWLTTARNYARYANDGGRYDDVLEFLKKHGK
ncbi:26S protease regulatory subunit, partial [Oleiphilus sp. HI0066]|uniref:ATP-binding protein n=5 Tax=unclassified Oleiphilus TaxID=2631174 RepID=UPI0007C2D38F